MTTQFNGEVFSSVQMMSDEVEYMVERVKSLKSGLMVEWGAGGSTELWLRTIEDDSELISIEHNKEWFYKVEALKYLHFSKRFSPILIDIENDHFTHGYGDVLEETPFNVAEYICPSYVIYDADIFFIDGIARGACLAGVLLNAKPGAEIYIHDYTPRVMAYDWITQFCDVDIVGTTLAKVSRTV